MFFLQTLSRASNSMKLYLAGIHAENTRAKPAIDKEIMKLYLAGPHSQPEGKEKSLEILGEEMKLFLAAPSAGNGQKDVIEKEMKAYLALANSEATYPHRAGILGGNINNEKTDDMNVDLSTPHTYKDMMYNSVVGGNQKLCILESFHYINKWMIPYIDNYWDFLLDSGAFTFMSSKKAANGVDWNSYIDRYADFINKHKINNFFELDIDSVVGLPRVKQLRKRLEARTERRCIPVWHKSRGLDNWKAITKDYNYVAIGGIVTKEIKRNERGVFNPLCDIAASNNSRVHGLGFTPSDGSLPKYKFYSVDSTSWIRGNIGGFLYHFDGRGGFRKTMKPEGSRMKSKAIAIHNFTEWVKFQRYMRGDH